jgi:hypothetical protein
MSQSALHERLEQLRKLQKDIPSKLMAAQTIAAKAAVEAATEATPPTKDTIRGTGMVTGELKARWALDSRVDSERSGDIYTTELRNNMQYAAAVNDGHRLDKHFVPGIMVNAESGLIERVDPETGGMIVGTQTKYVPGVFMKETARTEYEKRLLDELGKMLESD